MSAIVCMCYPQTLYYSWSHSLPVLMERMVVNPSIQRCCLETCEERCSYKVNSRTHPDRSYLIMHYNNIMCSPVYVNRDGLTGFGTPWEIRFQSNYTVLRKGGNVAGYSSVTSFIPDLKLGMEVFP